MANYTEILSEINDKIKPNGIGAITGQILNLVLKEITNTLGSGYRYAGIALPDTEPTEGDNNIFYLASQKGIYEHFNGVELDGESLAIFTWDGEWHSQTLPIAANSPMSVSYEELKDLRDNGDLEAGRLYRITDYATTTAQANTQSAGHPFDVVVLALSESELSEEALVMHREGDTYFEGCKLEAWKLMYCLDNDTHRFGWADEANGKGVIYRMVDEWGNDCPYDFKNIQFKGKDFFAQDIYRYTFNYDKENAAGTAVAKVWDTSIKGNDGSLRDDSISVVGVYDNEIKPYFKVIRPQGTYAPQTLNNIVLTATDHYTQQYNGCYGNVFGASCYNLMLNFCISNNIFGLDCHDNVLYDCTGNIFGNGFANNQVHAKYCEFGADCHDNIFGGTDILSGQIVFCKVGTEVQYVKMAETQGVNKAYILSGVAGTSGSPLTIGFTNLARGNEIACLDSQGALQIKVLGDIS